MKGSKDNKAKRKEFKNQFYRHNKLLFTLAIFATILIALLNLIISWEMQQIIDISTGMSTELSLLQITLIVAFFHLCYDTSISDVTKIHKKSHETI